MTIFEDEAKLFFNTYKRLPVEIDHGEGCYLIAKDGKKYLDMFSGLAVNALGYGHQGVTDAINAQARKYTHLSNFFAQPPQLELAERLLRHSGFQKIFFTNSGTEATEGTIKLARKWGSANGRTNIFGMTNGFSGRSMGSLSIMDKDKYREGYGPFLENCGFITFNDVNDLRAKVNSSTAAVFLEFIQGEGGVVPVERAFVDELEALRKKFGFLVVADEIQSGVMRTGKFFAYQHFNFRPDIVTIAKPIGGGLPLGAILGGPEVACVWSYGVHGTTFGGNPVACAAGKVVIDTVTSDAMQRQINDVSAYLLSKLQSLKAEHSIIKEIRGTGFMIGVDLSVDSAPLVDEMLSKGVLVNSTAKTVVRILPPLIAQQKEIDTLIAVFEGALRTAGV
ncbi:MAG TPA: acetylornithine/succinylornithine family transaminase [Bacteroidota bacterium]|nr:acetylornithine/succinylornithine family transaminase [Bacteroidota bacterium]